MGLHRPYIRKEVREEVERRAEKNEEGKFLDANTHQPIEGKYDLGHKAGHEHWREAASAEKEGLSQEEFNDRMNNPDYYQIEDPHENRSHAHEMPAEVQSEGQTESQTETQTEGQSDGQNQVQDDGQGEDHGDDM
ncbi:HNH/ENDO VII superfamily nuclease with conserved GHE residues [Ruminococcaceae bacterium YRB3002]|nr:HNH/ENDO VII superfamily nuclease with conserved GHE residues [Ruminococcaceae bacterium YRB3002]